MHIFTSSLASLSFAHSTCLNFLIKAAPTRERPSKPVIILPFGFIQESIDQTREMLMIFIQEPVS
jgi:hypothetical protein